MELRMAFSVGAPGGLKMDSRADAKPLLARVLRQVRELAEQVRETAERVHQEAEETHRLTTLARRSSERGLELSRSSAESMGAAQGLLTTSQQTSSGSPHPTKKTES